jgi:hypothetical protein
MKRWRRRVWKTLIALSVSGAVAYHNSARLSPLLIKNSHPTQNKLITDLDTKKQLQSDTLYKTDDKETNVILDLMAGYADKTEFNDILTTY